ncbi:unnamed protein product, partial [Amoebophrya sp. A120]
EDERIRSLQQTVQGAVVRLAADLYSGESHFLLELLQNADDCGYSENIVPALATIEQTGYGKNATRTVVAPAQGGQTSNRISGLLISEHCELGFREKDVRALCDIAQSTKKNKKFIGHKGVGFKSVFKVTSTPVIHSGEFSFHFDANALNGLGYLVPFPLRK